MDPIINQQISLDLLTLPKEIVNTILYKFSPFEWISLSTVSKGFDEYLNDVTFWASRPTNLIKLNTIYGLSPRSQFVMKAKYELNLMKKSVYTSYGERIDSRSADDLDENLDSSGYKITLINFIEMAKKAAALCPNFLTKVDSKLMADKSFVLKLIAFPKILSFASEEIQKDKEFNQLATLFNGPDSTTLREDKNFVGIDPTILNSFQINKYIKEVTESILGGIKKGQEENVVNI